MIRVTQASYVSDHRIHLWFSDGSHGEVDFAELLTGPIFKPLQDKIFFSRFRVEGHTLTWENNADFAPEYLHDLVHNQITIR